MSTATAAPVTTPVHRDRFLIGGAWVEPSSSGRIEVIAAPTEEVLGSVPEGTVADIDRAVSAAVAAREGWAATPWTERARRLVALADALAARSEEIAHLIALEVGMPLRMARSIQAGMPVTDLRVAAEELEALAAEERIGNSVVIRRPVGVVAAITPWNYPLHQAAAKVAGALGAGCTVVLKPSEIAPLTAFILAECSLEADLPPGVLNVVTGYGPVVGEALAGHPDVDMVSFTGSTAAGRRVAAVAAATVKRVALELGGKSPSIVLEGADLQKAVTATVNACMLNSGQTCTALTRLLVPVGHLDEALAVAAAAAERLTVGDPLAETSRLGPLASAAQRDRVRAHIEGAVADGARVVTGGVEAPQGLDRGFYVRPTVLADVTPGMRVAQEEVFGPVLSVLTYSSVDEAVAIADGTDYGLAAAVWGADEEQALVVARRLRSGQVDVNGGRFNPRAPFGGMKQSGIGRELGRFGVDEFCETVSLQLPV